MNDGIIAKRKQRAFNPLRHSPETESTIANRPAGRASTSFYTPIHSFLKGFHPNPNPLFLPERTPVGSLKSEDTNVDLIKQQTEDTSIENFHTLSTSPSFSRAPSTQSDVTVMEPHPLVRTTFPWRGRPGSVGSGSDDGIDIMDEIEECDRMDVEEGCGDTKHDADPTQNMEITESSQGESLIKSSQGESLTESGRGESLTKSSQGVSLTVKSLPSYATVPITPQKRGRAQDPEHKRRISRKLNRKPQNTVVARRSGALDFPRVDFRSMTVSKHLRSKSKHLRSKSKHLRSTLKPTNERNGPISRNDPWRMINKGISGSLSSWGIPLAIGAGVQYVAQKMGNSNKIGVPEAQAGNEEGLIEQSMEVEKVTSNEEKNVDRSEVETEMEEEEENIDQSETETEVVETKGIRRTPVPAVTGRSKGKEPEHKIEMEGTPATKRGWKGKEPEERVKGVRLETRPREGGVWEFVTHDLIEKSTAGGHEISNQVVGTSADHIMEDIVGEELNEDRSRDPHGSGFSEAEPKEMVSDFVGSGIESVVEEELEAGMDLEMDDDQVIGGKGNYGPGADTDPRQINRNDETAEENLRCFGARIDRCEAFERQKYIVDCGKCRSCGQPLEGRLSGDDGDIDDQPILPVIAVSSRGKQIRQRMTGNSSIDGGSGPEGVSEVAMERNPKHKIYTPKHRHADDNEFKAEIRREMAYLLNAENPDIRVADPQQVRRFENTKKAADGPNLDDIYFDFGGPSPVTPWNTRIAYLLAKKYIAEPGVMVKDQVRVKKAFTQRLRKLHASYQQSLRTLTLDEIAAEEIKARYVNQKARQYYQRNRRERVAISLATKGSTMAQHADLWKTIPQEACSEDEEVVYTSGPRFEKRTPFWRNPDVQDFFAVWDHLDIAQRYGPDGKPKGKGRFPHFRFQPYPPRKNLDAPIVPGLPLNFYDPLWYSTLDELEKEAINAQPVTDLTIPRKILSFAQRHAHIRTRADRPIPP